MTPAHESSTTAPADMRPYKGAGLRHVQRYRKWAFAAATSIILAVCPFLRSSWPSGTFIHEGLEAIGVMLIGAAVIGRAWCTLYIGGRKAQEVVRTGPYSVSRNPLYMFSFVAVFGAGLQAGSIVFGAILTLISFLILRPVIAREEEVLATRFGPQFTAYIREVPRFGPRLRAWSEADTLQASPGLFWHTIADGALFFLTVPVMEVLEHLQAAYDLPVWFRVP
jgi:protein-S-isoprenylcysteine O-methyltransferase Ste14